MVHGTDSTYVYYKCRCDECREARRKTNREHYQRNRAKRLGQAAKYREENRDATRAWFRENYQRNKEIIRATVKERRATPEGKRGTRRFNLKRRARVLDRFVEHVDSERVLIRDLGLCGICGGQIEEAFHVDHILPLSRGGVHSYANVQLAHPRCNLKKAAKS